MPDTGAPWNIPYVAASDLVKDWPTDNQEQAEAVADALDVAQVVKQRIQSIKDDVASTTSTTYTGTGVSVTITPTSASSKVIVDFSLPLAAESSAANRPLHLALYRDSTNLIVPDTPGNRSPSLIALNQNGLTSALYEMTLVSGSFMDSPATTSAITYEVYWKVVSTNTAYLNQTENDSDAAAQPRGVAWIRATEVV